MRETRKGTDREQKIPWPIGRLGLLVAFSAIGALAGDLLSRGNSLWGIIGGIVGALILFLALRFFPRS